MMPATGPPDSGFYDPDDVIPQSPVLVAAKVDTRPNVPDPYKDHDLPYSLHGEKAKPPKVLPTHGDAVLISLMGFGRDPDVAATAAREPLPGEQEAEDDATSPSSDEEFDDAEDTSTSPEQISADYRHRLELPLSPPSDLKMMANNALAAQALAQLDLNKTSVSSDGGTPTQPSATEMEAPRTMASPVFPAARPHTAAVRNERPHPVSVFPTPYSPGSAIYTPRTGSFASPTDTLGHESLPPIQNASPRSESNVGINLPSLKDQFGPEALSPTYAAHSPPGPSMYPGMSRLPSMSHGSPPVSPHELNHRSPHQTIMSPSLYAPWAPNGISHHRPSIDFNGSTPSDQSASTLSTPATSTSVADRMSIDGMAFSNSGEQGQYICTVDGCKAPPFQTQYLLNSHANVHSQSRPHYCPVKNCPRAEGGKGFKRKNEMIRHGLVHESPGYVCPFCPDREHKYPRPDNLQRYVQSSASPACGSTSLTHHRHVRVHHPERDKDDMQLRDVLSQRCDGPSRGRRRRGVS